MLSGITMLRSRPPPSLLKVGLGFCRTKATLAFDVRTKVLENDSLEKNNDLKFITHPAFPHEKWSDEDCAGVEYLHRPPKSRLDRIAHNSMNFCKTCFNMATGYKKPVTDVEKQNRFKGTRWEMTENKWLTRVIFLESVAGVPGMVAAFLRHLHSLRLLKRDKAWIETLLDEAYNERMHLLTFIKIGQPSTFMRFFVYMGQGVFCNMFFFLYLLSPRYCHRFVGYLEEEAVSTYTHLVDDLAAHRLPKFDAVSVPKIAQDYWPELNEKSTFLDLVLRVRADESKHREVNHTLANLDQKDDRNPYAMKIEGVEKPQPDNGLKGINKVGWEKEDLIL